MPVRSVAPARRRRRSPPTSRAGAPGLPAPARSGRGSQPGRGCTPARRRPTGPRPPRRGPRTARRARPAAGAPSGCQHRVGPTPPPCRRRGLSSPTSRSRGRSWHRSGLPCRPVRPSRTRGSPGSAGCASVRRPGGTHRRPSPAPRAAPYRRSSRRLGRTAHPTRGAAPRARGPLPRPAHRAPTGGPRRTSRRRWAGSGETRRRGYAGRQLPTRRTSASRPVWARLGAKGRGQQGQDVDLVGLFVVPWSHPRPTPVISTPVLPTGGGAPAVPNVPSVMLASVPFAARTATRQSGHQSRFASPPVRFLRYVTEFEIGPRDRLVPRPGTAWRPEPARGESAVHRELARLERRIAAPHRCVRLDAWAAAPQSRRDALAERAGDGRHRSVGRPAERR